MNLKIKWLRDKLKSLNLQGMIISNPINIRYLTNIDAEGTLIITRKENIYITDSRYIEMANSVLTIEDDIIVCDIRDLSSYDYENFFLFCENVGFEENYATYAQYKEYMHKYKINNLVETENIIEKQRSIKELDEISMIKKACEITDNCFTHLVEFIKKGMTEKQIELEIERFFKLNGADGTAFSTVVASGPNSSMPHAYPSDRQLYSGDVLTIDMGCKYKGYSSDMTRTIFIDYIPEGAKNLYDLILKNQRMILNELKEGINTKNISKMVESDFKLHGHIIIHALGHNIGLETHELPYMSVKSDNFLKENMVMTIEPGIYIPSKFGIRIEDTVLITKNGCITLTNSDKNYIILKSNNK